MDINSIINGLSPYGIKQTGPDKYQARCCSHDDRTASLTITVTDEKILLHCFAGCSAESIMSDLGLSMTDLFPESDFDREAYKKSKQIKFHRKQFMRDWVIVKLAQYDVNRGKLISPNDRKTARECIARLEAYNFNVDQAYFDCAKQDHRRIKREVLNKQIHFWKSKPMSERLGA